MLVQILENAGLLISKLSCCLSVCTALMNLNWTETVCTLSAESLVVVF